MSNILAPQRVIRILTGIMLVSISGPSASGKTTVARKLIEHFGGTAPLLISHTTRAPRPSDIPGEYTYISGDEFENLKSSGAFLWTADVYGNRYGTLRLTVEENLNAPLSFAILTIPATESLYRFLKEEGREGELLPLYLRIADEEVLRQRLVSRGDAEKDIAVRLVENRNWDALREASVVPFHIIDSSKDRDGIVEDAKKIVAGEAQKRGIQLSAS